MPRPYITAQEAPKVLLLGIYTPFNALQKPDHYFEEFKSLVTTLGVHVHAELNVKLREVDKSYFLTKGKLEEVTTFCHENKIEQVICSPILSPLQERNLATAFDCDVFDREQLILEIFRNAAQTAEGKIQVEMAHIEYLKTRLAGKGKEFAQQEGRIGSRGPGEAAKETLKRFFALRMSQAKKRLETLHHSRTVQRQQRLESKIPLICLVGYTNAGKSSILNRLTKSDILAQNQLFSTLDTTTRELFYDGAKKVLISDTVGFISQLPHHLIEAFKSTLDELKYAHLLFHVIDISNPAWKDHILVVQSTLHELNVTSPVLYVFNKADKLSDLQREEQEHAIAIYQPHVLIHTKDRQGIVPLLTYLRNHPL